MKDYPAIVRDISRNMRTLRQDAPDVMQGFSALAQAATKTQKLDKKTKELIALAIGVAMRWLHRLSYRNPGASGSE